MSYELHFHPLALKEWKKLTKDIQEQFKDEILEVVIVHGHLRLTRTTSASIPCYA